MQRVAEKQLEPIGWVENGEVLMGYNGEKFTGISEEQYPNGQMQSEIMYCEGVRDGWEKTYYEDGTLQSFCQIRITRNHGKQLEYFSDGNIHIDAFYEMSILTKRKEYNEKGNLVSDFVIEDHAKKFHELQVEKEYAHKNGFYHEFYREDGSLVFFD